MKSDIKFLSPGKKFKGQRGQGLLAMLMVVVLGLGAAIFVLAGPAGSRADRDKITAAALARAKTALIGYAAGVNLGNDGRPGDLPCPDTLDEGEFGLSSCGNTAGTTGQTVRLGRLPWKSLGLSDLRDGDGERLWYAVSVNFKKHWRTACSSPGDAGCLNSESRGTITVRNSTGDVIHDGSTSSAVIAVIFSPGGVIRRQGAAAAQIRDCSGEGCTSTGACKSKATPKCDPVNYLDVMSGIEDNAGFTDGSPGDGFISGPIRDAAGNLIVNDRLITITYGDLMPLLERRVAREVLNSLNAYADTNNGRYPWAAPVSNAAPPYVDQAGTRFGRIPDTMNASVLGLGGNAITLACGILPLCMSSAWPHGATVIQGSWWTNWKNQVFYAVAEAYTPSVTATLLPLVTVSIPHSSGCGNCLTVNPPSAAADKRVVVMVAGKPLGTQQRATPADRQNPANYLENENLDRTGASADVYASGSPTSTFNDFLSYR